MKWIALCLVLVLIPAVPARADATPAWESDLTADGWAEVKRKLTDFTDHTWYGQANDARSTEGWVYYLRPGGRTGVLRSPRGKLFVDHRSEGEDGRICSLIKELRGGRQLCGNRLWKRGEIYMFTNPDGRTIHTWKWAKGNPEGFSPE